MFYLTIDAIYRFVRRLEELLDVDEIDEILNQQQAHSATDSRTISGISDDDRQTAHSLL